MTSERARSPRTIVCPVGRNAQRVPAATALKFEGGAMDWRDYDALVRQWEGRLRDTGAQPGDRMAVLAANSPDFAALFFAVLRVGAVLVPLSCRLDAARWRTCLQRARATLLSVDQKYQDFARDQGSSYLLLGQDVARAAPSAGQAAGTGLTSGTTDVPALPLDQPAAIFFTSGSSGTPKGVVLTLGNLYYNAVAANENLPLHAHDCWLACLPFYHVGGVAVLLRTALAGCPAYVRDGFEPVIADRLLAHGESTVLSCVPTMLRALLAQRGDAPAPPTLKAVLLGGGPASSALFDDCARLSVPVLPTYGMTETASQICTRAPDDLAARALDRRDSVGRALRHVEVKIVTDDGSPVDADRVGEIVVRGETVFKRYLDADAETTAAPGGWFHTGDLGFLDGDRCLHVVGRRDRMFISGGENIYPEEIESAAAGFPAVAECAVVAVPDRQWDRRPVLFVTADPETPLDPAELEVFLASRLPRLLRPDAILETATMPRLSVDKIDYRALLAAYLKRKP